jgi:hypothetical protein
VASSIRSDALITDFAPSVPAIHAAVPAIETAAAAFRTNTLFSHRKFFPCVQTESKAIMSIYVYSLSSFCGAQGGEAPTADFNQR